MAFNQTPFIADQAMDFPFLPPPLSGSQEFFTGIDENGVGSSFQENIHLYPNHQQVDPFFGSSNQSASFLLPSSSPTDILSVEVPQSLPLSLELERQTAEMQTYLQLQNQRLSAILQEETRQRDVVVQNFSNNLMSLIQQKENEELVANQTSIKLQQQLATTDMELQTWKNKAIEKESVVAKLTQKLKKVQDRMAMMTAGAPDSSSTYGGETPKNKLDITMEHKCKLCGAEKLCVLLLPCKHLCFCRSCEVKLGFCPICGSLKEGSMEIYLA